MKNVYRVCIGNSIRLLRKLINIVTLSVTKGLKFKILRYAQNDKRQFPKKSIVYKETTDEIGDWLSLIGNKTSRIYSV